jgi:hypothetical protein
MRRREAGRGAVPAGSISLIEHSGGAGAPPGSITSPCQELAEIWSLRYRASRYLSALGNRPSRPERDEQGEARPGVQRKNHRK